jgi:hypothetical protein
MGDGVDQCFEDRALAELRSLAPGGRLRGAYKHVAAHEVKGVENLGVEWTPYIAWGAFPQSSLAVTLI